MFLFNSLFISHILVASDMQDQPITISGYVYDNENLPMVGVTVRLKDTPIGTITNLEGYYELTVPTRGSVLQFSFVGFITTEIAVEESGQVNIEMKVDVLGLDEVVVIGYGVLKKSHLTGSVSRLRNDNLAEVPVTRLDQALQEKLQD
jgi:TonB-dependent starch-binding outer membrane protein SusC